MRIRKLAAAAALGLAFTCVPVVAHASTMYENDNYNYDGPAKTFTSNGTDWVGTAFNDKASSLRGGKDCYTYYDNIKFSGSHIRLCGDYNSLGAVTTNLWPGNWGDRISSFKS